MYHHVALYYFEKVHIKAEVPERLLVSTKQFQCLNYKAGSNATSQSCKSQEQGVKE